MVRLILPISLCLTAALPASADWIRVNMDTKTAAQVTLNTGYQEAVELLHTAQTDTLVKKEEKMSAMAATMAATKNIFLLTLENAKGFGVESGIYRSMSRTCLSIASQYTETLELAGKSNHIGKSLALIQLYHIAREAVELGNLFSSVVTDASVPNPFRDKMAGAHSGVKEKYNLLNRYERMGMALKIASRLRKIDHELRMMNYYFRKSSFGNLVYALDRKTWTTYYYSKFTIDHLISQWNSLVHK